jgi:hypothetical protein
VTGAVSCLSYSHCGGLPRCLSGRARKRLLVREEGKAAASRRRPSLYVKPGGTPWALIARVLQALRAAKKEVRLSRLVQHTSTQRRTYHTRQVHMYG